MSGVLQTDIKSTSRAKVDSGIPRDRPSFTTFYAVGRGVEVPAVPVSPVPVRPLSPSIHQTHINPNLVSLLAKESLNRSETNKGLLHTFSLNVKPKPTSEKV
jgi:hypothetical protein